MAIVDLVIDANIGIFPYLKPDPRRHPKLPQRVSERCAWVHRQIGAGELRAAVPWLFMAEVGGTIFAAYETKIVKPSGKTSRKLGAERSLEAVLAIDALGLVVAEPELGAAEVYLNARKWRMQSMDAVYVDLALRLGVPLLTVDQGTIDGCRKAGVKVFPLPELP